MSGKVQAEGYRCLCALRSWERKNSSRRGIKHGRLVEKTKTMSDKQTETTQPENVDGFLH
jgi:hypothetical protein